MSLKYRSPPAIHARTSVRRTSGSITATSTSPNSNKPHQPHGSQHHSLCLNPNGLALQFWPPPEQTLAPLGAYRPQPSPRLQTQLAKPFRESQATANAAFTVHRISHPNQLSTGSSTPRNSMYKIGCKQSHVELQLNARWGS